MLGNEVSSRSNESWRGSQDDWTQNSYERTGRDGYNDYIDQLAAAEDFGFDGVCGGSSHG